MTKLNSSFWLDKRFTDKKYAAVANDRDNTKDISELIKLSGVKTAVSNFVNIVTNQRIPVTFKQRGDSYTDGKSVVISGSFKKEKDFDIMVGLALHEGSHILLSDFSILKDMEGMIPTNLKERAKEFGINDSREIVKNFTNYVEDRRIDYFIFSESPGYREYYRSMYNKYFNDRLITKTLQSNEYTTESVDSYMFRIINMHADESDLSKLKGLREIYREVDLQNISRLKSSKDSFEVALNMFKIMLNYLDKPTAESEGDGESSDGDSGDDQSAGTPSTSQSGMERDEESSPSNSLGSTGNPQGESDDNSSDEETDSDSSGGNGEEENDEESDSDSNDGNGDEEETDEETDSDSNDGDGEEEADEGVNRANSKDLDDDAPELTERQKRIIDKKIDKQKKFLDGDVRKTSLSKQDLELIDELSNSDIELVSVGHEMERDRYGDSVKPIDVIVANKLTDSLFRSYHFPLTGRWDLRRDVGPYEEEVQEGIKQGRILAKKLQVRSEERTTIFNRQKKGRMDKRMIASLGYGNENVFYYKDVDSFNDLNLHISIDASGSMGGRKWTKTIINITTLLQAVEIIPNLEVQVTMRTTKENKPYIAKVFDSREDSMIKVKKYFPYLRPTGTTPEGLTFEAIMENFIQGTNNQDSYFLNISDGQPYFQGNGMYYSGEPAEKHTKKQVNYIKQRGIKVLSYYVGDDSDIDMKAFKAMYGREAKFIDISNIKEITRTMNKFFLEK